MSYLSIADFLKAGQKSIDDENYWSALSISLMLPSICSRLTYAGNEDYLNPNGKPKDYKSYTDWCKENISKDGWIKMCLGENYADVLYQLRCDIVHAGCANIFSDGKRTFLSYGKSVGMTQFELYRIIDVKTLCESILGQVNAWYATADLSGMKYTRVFDMGDDDDKLLYNKLCDEERAKFLMKEFKSEIGN